MSPSKKTTDTKPTAKKRGKQSDIQGKRDEYLQPFIEKYAAVAKARKSVFWKDLFPGYWAAFPWRLPLNQEPAEDDATDYARPPEDDKEVDMKENVMAETEKTYEDDQKIKLWFSRHRSTNASGVSNPYSRWLAQLRRPPGPTPKKLAAYQYYMQHASYKDVVSKLLKKLHGDPSSEDHLKLRSEVARGLFTKESADVQKKMEEGAKEDHKKKMAEHRARVEGLPSLDPAEQAEARKLFGSVVWPLLDALRAHTGYDITLFAGLVEFEEGKLPAVNCVSVHAEVNTGTPPELYFSKAPHYDLSLKGFGRFVWDARRGRCSASSHRRRDRAPAPRRSRPCHHFGPPRRSRNYRR
ncbi:hypothetical protein B0H11DRAFT_1945530 [Mycena galericulata]|nr:hypothetical protein B0H11DRAFT_1945530 [Mycena galericulata]